MPLFRRTKVAAIDPNVGSWAFWRWWQAEGATQMAASLAGENGGGVQQQLTARVAEIDPRLTWSVAPGVRAKHRLVVSGNGDPNVLLTARRWLRKAAEEDRVWEYGDQRPAMENVAGLTLSVDGLAIEPDDVTVVWARRGYWVDVRMHHPLFAEQPEVIRTSIATQVLDAVLGERDADLWIGRVASPPDGTALKAPAFAIRQVVAEVKGEFTDEIGKPVWTSFSGLSNGRRVTASALVKLTPVLAPQLDHHLRIVVPFIDLDVAGEPSTAALAALNAIVDDCESRLGRSALLVAYETARGTRTLHFYVDSMTTAAEHIKAAFVAWRQGKVKSSVTGDAHWSIVGHLRR